MHNNWFGLKEFSIPFHSVASLMDQWIPPKLRSILYLLIGVASSVAYYQSVNVVWLVLALVGFAAAMATRKQWVVKSTLSKPRCWAGIEQQLKSRDTDIKTLASAMSRHRLVFLVGQSGCGKSSLVRLGLIPVLVRDAEKLPLYIDNWGVDPDWTRGPQAAIAAVLFAALTEDERIRCGIDPQSQPGEILNVLEVVKTQLGREPVLLFDRLEDYQIQYGDRLIKRGRIVSRKKLIKSNPFWKEISHLLNNEKIRCLFITRDVTSPAVESFRFQKPVVYILEPLDSVASKQLIAGVMEPCVRNPECGWLRLQDRLVADMEHNGRILPIRIKRVLQSLDGIRFLTIEHYERVGQITGLQAESIKDQIKQTAVICGWRYSDVLLLLTRLIASTSSQSVARTSTQLLDDLPQLKSYGHTFSKLMDGLASQSTKIVQEVIIAETGEFAWRLDRDDLSEVITEVDRQQRHWQSFLNHAADRFERSIGIWRKFSALLSPWQQVRLLVARLRGTIRYGSRAYYARLSTLRLVLNARLLLSVFLLLGLIHQLHRIESTKAAELLSEFTVSRSIKISEAEKVSLWRLSIASSGIKRRFIEQTIASGPNADRFLLHADRIGVAALGLGLETRESIVRNPLQAICYDKTPGDFRRVRACLAWLMMADANAARIAVFIAETMEQEQRSWRELVELAGALGKLGDGDVPPELIDRAADRLVTAMEQDDRSAEELGGFAEVLGELGDRVPQELVSRGAECLIKAMERDDLSRRELHMLARALSKLGAQIAPESLGGFTRRLEAVIGQGDHTAEGLGAYATAVDGLGGRVPKDSVSLESDRLVVSEQPQRNFATAPGSLAGKLDGVEERVSPDQAGVLAEQIVMAIQQDDRSWSERVQFARALVGLSDRVSPDQARTLTERLVEAMEREGRTATELSAFAEVIHVLSNRVLTDQDNRAFAERLTLAMERDDRSAADLYGLARALGGLGQGVPQEFIKRGSERLVVSMEQDNRSLRELVSLAKGLSEYGEGMPQEFASRGLEQLVRAMEQQSRSRWDMEMLAGVLGMLGKYAPAHRVTQTADRLVAAMEREGRCAEELGALARGFGQLSEVLTSEQRTRLLSYTTEKIKQMANPPCEVIAELVMEEDELANLLDVLKWPTCSSRARDELVNRSNDIMQWTITEESTQSDAWRFLNHVRGWEAQQKNYALDASVPLPKEIPKDAHSIWRYLW